MNCSKCGALNDVGFKFCVKCGNPLVVENTVTSENQNNQENKELSIFPNSEQASQITQVSSNDGVNQEIQVEQKTEQVNVSSQQSIVQSSNVNSTVQVGNKPLNYIMYIINVLLKPFKTFKEEETKLCNIKISLVFSGIIAVAMMLIGLIKSMISVVFVKTLDYSTFDYKTTVEFSNLKDLDYLSLIGKNLLIYAGIIAAIAFIYYIIGLIFKKTVNFIKLLSISATSLLPFIVLGMIISPLLGKIWAPLYIVTFVVGVVYSILIFMNLVNEEIVFDNKDIKIYFHLICLAILVVAGYYLSMNLLIDSIATDLGSTLDLFG